MRRAACIVAAAVALACDPVVEEEALTPNDGAADNESPRVDEEPIADEAVDEVESEEEEEATEETLPASISVADIMERTRRRWSGEVQISRDEIWNVPDEGGPEATATGLHRICASEVEFANLDDCIGIWQVIGNVRARHCDRERSRMITECLDGEETMLSAMRRASRRAMGMVPPLSRRGHWIQNLELSCEEPEDWPERRTWEGRMRERCEDSARLARALVNGERSDRLTRAVPIAWGGRCERHCDDPTDLSTCRQTGACDDRIACRRGLVRVPDTRTRNAFWCRPGTTRCPDEIDPVCVRLGFGEPPDAVPASLAAGTPDPDADPLPGS